MLQWIKDWAPILATIGTLLGVLVTVRQAAKSYSHGLIEKRKDHQRELLADLVAATRLWCESAEIIYMAMAKMSDADLFEFANTDTTRAHGELSTAVHTGLIKCLCEVGDIRIEPLLDRLDRQRGGVTAGDDAAPLFNSNAPGEARFQALGVVTRRIRAIAATCNELQSAAVQALRVEIDVLPIRRQLWNRLKVGVVGILPAE